MPPNWNGTLLLYSHGYSPTDRAPDLAPRGTADWLAAHGYALAAARYSTPGWAVAEAVPEQIALREEFLRRFGRPRRTIAWGSSMGGLITVALAEQYPTLIDAALPSCGSLAGALGMMNQALDGAFAFKVLLAPDLPIGLVHIIDDRANAERVQAAADRALLAPVGRARLGLAMALAQLPVGDVQAVHSFAAAVFLPRQDQEQRAGGVASWNTGVDYRRQLSSSGQAAQVRALYAHAHVNLDADLRTLNSAPRIVADPEAVAYMRLHYVPNGVLRIPTFSYHTVGDLLTVATQQLAYANRVRDAGHSIELRLGWVARAGHCDFTPAEHLAALHVIEERLTLGEWQVSTDALNSWRPAPALGDTSFTEFHAADFLRPCAASPCPGEPRSNRNQ